MNKPNPVMYTLVGSRETPHEPYQLMVAFARKMSLLGYMCRTGDAKLGGDKAAREGAGALCQIFRPDQATPEAMEIAGRFHPAWNAVRKDGSPVVSDFAKRLHGRNSFQVLGPELNDPSYYFMCWTPDGCLHHNYRQRITGGTGTAISIASMYGVPHMYNLFNQRQFNEVVDWVNAA